MKNTWRYWQQSKTLGSTSCGKLLSTHRRRRGCVVEVPLFGTCWCVGNAGIPGTAPVKRRTRRVMWWGHHATKSPIAGSTAPCTCMIFKCFHEPSTSEHWVTSKSSAQKRMPYHLLHAMGSVTREEESSFPLQVMVSSLPGCRMVSYCPPWASVLQTGVFFPMSRSCPHSPDLCTSNKNIPWITRSVEEKLMLNAISLSSTPSYLSFTFGYFDNKLCEYRAQSGEVHVCNRSWWPHQLRNVQYYKQWSHQLQNVQHYNQWSHQLQNVQH